MQEKYSMTEFNKKRGYAIGALSRLTNVNIETIRYYERIGILPRPDRTAGGNRQYNHPQLKRLFFIKRCRDMGFSLKEVRTLLELVDRQDFICSEVHDLTESHLVSVRQKQADLKRLEQTLQSMVSQCKRGDVPECPIIDELFDLGSERHSVI